MVARGAAVVDHPASDLLHIPWAAATMVVQHHMVPRRPEATTMVAIIHIHRTAAHAAVITEAITQKDLHAVRPDIRLDHLEVQ